MIELIIGIITTIASGTFAIWKGRQKERAQAAQAKSETDARLVQLELERVKAAQETARQDTQVQTMLIDLLRRNTEVSAAAATSIDTNTQILRDLIEHESTTRSEVDRVAQLMNTAAETMQAVSASGALQRNTIAEEVRQGNGKILRALADVLQALEDLAQEIKTGMITQDQAKQLFECISKLKTLLPDEAINESPAPVESETKKPIEEKKEE